MQLEEALQALGGRVQAFAEPERLALLRKLLMFAAGVWIVFALVQLIWSLVPPPTPAATPKNVLNPLLEPAGSDTAKSVNIDQLVALELFGRAAAGTGAGGAPLTPEQVAKAAAEAEAAARAARGGDALEGIEDRAKETRLSLVLRGVMASSDQTQARAIIESKKKQVQYAVGDELAIKGVKLAKVLATMVVLDNKGRYERLTLFDPNKSGLIATPVDAGAAADSASAQRPAATTVDRRADSGLTQIAASYRKRLYENPQSLAQVVNIAPERDGSELIGYRVRPGRDAKEFEALGFKQNDIVTGVNGIELTDPGKAIELYRAMKTADEASFDVLRDGQSITLLVGLEGPGE